jgi:hypothetical protein
MDVESKYTNGKWQFLRRDQAYRDDYAVFRTLKSKLELKYGPLHLCTWQMLIDEPDAWHYSPAKKASESDSVWLSRAICEGYDPRKALIHIGYARCWGLTEMVDPDQSSSHGVSFLAEERPPIWHCVDDIEVLNQDEDEGGPPTVFYTRLDATKSATWQVAELRKALVALQSWLKEQGLRWRTSLHPDKWPLYLRVFDDFAAGATAKEIAKDVFPNIPDEYPDYLGQARVRATLEQALSLVRGGYRRISSTGE